MYKVFLSSTSRDLGSYRDQIYETLQRMRDVKVIRGEDFVAEPNTPLETCRREVEDCHIFVGLVGNLYGSAPKRHQHSYSQLEFRWARDAGIPCLMHVAPKSLLMRGDLREPEHLHRRQSKFREDVRLLTNAPDAAWQSTEVLAAVVAESVRRQLSKLGIKEENRNQPPLRSVPPPRNRLVRRLISAMAAIAIIGVPAVLAFPEFAKTDMAAEMIRYIARYRPPVATPETLDESPEVNADTLLIDRNEDPSLNCSGFFSMDVSPAKIHRILESGYTAYKEYYDYIFQRMAFSNPRHRHGLDSAGQCLRAIYIQIHKKVGTKHPALELFALRTEKFIKNQRPVVSKERVPIIPVRSPGREL